MKMKMDTKTLAKIFSVLYLIGLILSVVWLMGLPRSLQFADANIDMKVIASAAPVFWQLNAVLISTLLIGLITIFSIIFLLSKSDTKIKDNELRHSAEVKEEKAVKEENGQAEHGSIDKMWTAIAPEKDKTRKAEKLLAAVCHRLEASQGLYYTVLNDAKKRMIALQATFAYSLPDSDTLQYEFGEGLAGQAAKEGRKLNLKDIPKGYINIISGLGKANPSSLLIMPIMADGLPVALVEIASFKEISAEDEALVQEAFARLLADQTGKEKVAEQKMKEKKTV